MPLQLKSFATTLSNGQKALKRRVSDEEHKTLSEKEVDARLKTLLLNSLTNTKPTLVPNLALSSSLFRRYLKDIKMFVGLLAERTLTVDRQIKNTSERAFGRLKDIQREVFALDSSVTEDEIKAIQGYTTVHFNAFTRSIDSGLGTDNTDWLTDYKTGVTFLEDNFSTILPTSGLVRPIRARHTVLIKDIEIVGESTDVGDSLKPILHTSPRNLLFKNNVFRHVVIRREFDRTTRRYKRNLSSLTLLVTLANVSLINHISIEPLGESTLDIASISYINPSGEEISLDTSLLTLEGNLIAIFEPIHTKFLQIELTQNAPVTKTKYSTGDLRTRAINKKLRGLGFSQLLDEKIDTLQGRVFDFSLESLSVGLIEYESLGVFRSRPIKVESPVGLSISDKTETIKVTSNLAYAGNLALPDSLVLNEYYVGVHLKDKASNLVLRDLIPVPDQYPIQSEFLPIVGNEAKVKLFPDMIWNLDSIRLVSVTRTAAFTLTFVTEQRHNFKPGDVITAIGPREHPINRDFEISSVIDEFSFIVMIRNAFQYEISENDLPKTIVYLSDTEDLVNQDPPLVVSKGSEELQIGVDYDITLDAGATWHSDWPRDSRWLEALKEPRSGLFRIRFALPDHSSTYWIKYRPLRNQFLGNTKLCRLKNGKVVFDKHLRNTTGTFNTVIVSRADRTNPYISSIILFYSLKIREHVA